MIYPGCKVAVMGLGISGRAAVKYLLQRGATVSVSDHRLKEQFLRDEEALLSNTAIEWEADGHTHEFLRKADLIIVSPGVDLNTPLIQELQKGGVRIVGELAVAAPELKVPCVAVTGTNGKTTVTTLIGELLREAGKKVFVGGNIGTPLFDYLCDPGEIDVVVVEVSSFQLESAGSFAPDVAVLLNISPDHLDRHGTLESYIQAKKQLFENQQQNHLAIACGDDSVCRRLVSGLSPQVQLFGGDGDCSAIITGNEIAVHNQDKKTFTLEGTALSGGIGALNGAAAILVAKSLGCTLQQIQQTLKRFKPLAHRLEHVADVAGVSYYNDSKATNTGAVISALQQFNNNVILIAGGRDKGDDYRLLRKSVAKRVNKIVVIGEAAELMEDALTDIVDMVRADSLQEAVQIGSKSAEPGDVVLLSPACASFDMFLSYGHRGMEFTKAVLALGDSGADKATEQAN